MSFSPGDFVECIETAYPLVSKGVIYKVQGSSDSFVQLESGDDTSNTPVIVESSKFKFYSHGLPVGINQTALPNRPLPFAPLNHQVNGIVPTPTHSMGSLSSSWAPSAGDLFIPDNMYDQPQKPINNVTSQRKKDGLCPTCGAKGYFHHLALVCDEHGEY